MAHRHWSHHGDLPRRNTVQIDTASDSGATAGILEKLYVGDDDWCGRSLARRISQGKGQI